jgi:transposase
MAKGYRPVDRDQPFLFPPDMREWLPGDHPVWLVITVVEDHLDTSAFHARRRTGGAGTAGYDPDMLATVLVWAYAHGVTSSREIERLCGTDVAFRVICAGNLPDHVTFARFRSDFPGAVGEFFAQVLVLCARLGMGKLGTVALDGMKIAASASKAANRTGEGLRKLAEEAVAAHAAADAAEDELFGPGRRGDEVPEAAWSPRERAGRIAAALADLEAERKAAEQAEAAKAEEFRGAAAGRAAERIAGALAPDHGPVAPSATSLRVQAPSFHGRLEDALADCQRGPQLPAHRNDAQCQGLSLRTRAIIRLATGNPWTRCGTLSPPPWTSSRARALRRPPSESSPAKAHAKRPPLTRGTTGYVLDLADYTGQPELSRSADIA